MVNILLKLHLKKNNIKEDLFMKIIKTGIPELLVVQPKVFGDKRGYFYETYNEKTYQGAGILNRFCQDNLSKSSYGVIRGLHFQLRP